MRLMRWLVLAALSVAVPRTAFAGSGHDFIAEARVLYRAVACAGNAELPAELDQGVVDEYCGRLLGSMQLYRMNYVEGASRFLEEIVPRDIPTTVVYPFGGGDLISALTTYPWLTEVTTISLEHAGDPRRVMHLKKKELAQSLDVIRRTAGGLLVWNDSKSTTLSSSQRNDLPVELSLFLIGLAAHGFRPVSLKYFRLENDGSIHYLEDSDIAALEGRSAGRLHAEWTAPDFSPAFSNSEIGFVPVDAPPDAPVRFHRHIAANLANDRLQGNRSLLRHLEAKGRVTAMTKAASYLLWQKGFSMIRDYLLANMEYMVSDSTGIPPSFAEPAGFVQETWGVFEGSYLGAAAEYNGQFKRLWAVNPTHPLPFRYGYIDSGRHYHLLITRRPRAIELLEEPTDIVAGGKHWRFWTEREVVHAWIPQNYRPESAGVVIYVHGYFVNADQAWVEHQLAEQFRASGKNALFIVPEASADDTEEPFWKSLAPLISEVLKATNVPSPRGPVIAVAHSGGYRTVINWLGQDALEEIVLLDGLYFFQAELEAWLAKRSTGHEHRLILASSAADKSPDFAKNRPGAFVKIGIPESAAELVKPARKARLVYLESQYPHMEMVTTGKVIPIVLALTSLSD